jgi:hypothetical protein
MREAKDDDDELSDSEEFELKRKKIETPFEEE